MTTDPTPDMWPKWIGQDENGSFVWPGVEPRTRRQYLADRLWWWRLKTRIRWERLLIRLGVNRHDGPF